MKTIRKLTLSFLLLLAIGGMLLACKPQETGIELKYAEGGEAYNMLLDEADVSVITFEVWENGELREQLRATPDMFSSSDLVKLQQEGQYTLTLNYAGSVLYVSVRVVRSAPVNEYTATFYAAPGAFSDGTDTKHIITSNNGQLVSLPVTPTREGYRFAGWYTDPEFGSDPMISTQDVRTKLTADTSYYARWRDERSFSVTFHGAHNAIIPVNGNDSVTGIEYGTVFPANLIPRDPVMDGYKFSYWGLLTSAPGEEPAYEPWDKTAPITQDLHIYAVFEEQFYTLSFYIDGALFQSYRVPAGGSFGTATSEYKSIPTATPREGHTVRWVDEDTRRTIEASYPAVRKNYRFNAEYTPISYTYTFHFTYNDADTTQDTAVGFDGAALQAQPQQFTNEYGFLFRDPPEPTSVRGHTASWYYYDAVERAYLPADALYLRGGKVSGNMDFYPHYTRRTYTIYFRNGNETLGTPLTKRYGDAIGEGELPDVDYTPRSQEISWHFYARFTDDPIDFSTYRVTPDSDSVTIYLQIKEKPRIVEFVFPSLTTDDDSEYNNLPLDEAFLNRFEHLPGGQVLIRRDEVPVANENPRLEVPRLVDDKYEIIGWKINGVQVTLENGSRLEVADFYQVGDTPGPVVAIVRVKSYDVNFYRVLDDFSGYAIDSDRSKHLHYGAYVTAPAEGTLVPPTGDSEASYQFGGWYTSPELTGVSVNFANERVNGPMNYYPRWYDPNAGTAGLEYVYHPGEEGALGYYEVVGYAGTESNILVPRAYSAGEGTPTAPVTHIAKGAFYNSALAYTAQVSEVALYVNNIQVIEDGAFDNLDQLASVVFRGIDAGTPTSPFRKISGLLYRLVGDQYELIVSPAKNNDPAATAADFWTDFRLPSNVSRIGQNAFMNNLSLQAFTVTDTATPLTIADGAFYGASALLSVSLGQPVEIGQQAFGECRRLATITFDAQRLQVVSTDAFEDTAWYQNESGETVVLNTVLLLYRGTTEVFNVPDDVTVLATGALSPARREQSDNLKTVSFGEHSQLRRIAARAFEGCHTISRVEILCGNVEADVVDIEAGAFNGLQGKYTKFVVNSAMKSAYEKLSVVMDYFGEVGTYYVGS